MRIAVMGAGGVGGYFGGLLAKAGNEVTMIARGPHLEALRSHGLQVKSPQGDFTVGVDATDDPGEVGPVELVLFTVKTYHNAAAIPAIVPLIGEVGAVLTLQNGVDSYRELMEAVGSERVLPGATNIGSSIEAPGVINHRGSSAGILFGELDGQESPRARRIVKIFRRAGIAIDLSPDVVKTLWTKLVVAASVAGITSAARVPAKRLLQYQEAREKTVAAMREVEAVGLAKGVNLDGDVVERMMEALNHFRDNEKASMHTDLEMGKPLELDALNGAVVRIGREVGVPTPIHSALYSILLAHKDGSLGGTS